MTATRWLPITSATIDVYLEQFISPLVGKRKEKSKNLKKMGDIPF